MTYKQRKSDMDMKMATKIILFAIIMVVASVSIISALVMIENTAYDKVSYDRLATATMDLNNKINQLREQSQAYAVLISQTRV